MGAGSFGWWATGRIGRGDFLPPGRPGGRLKHWAWAHPNAKMTDDEWKGMFDRASRSGLQALHLLSHSGSKAFYESAFSAVESKELEKLLPLAKERGLEVHAWICALNCNAEAVAKSHPEWFVVSREGISTLVKQPYVPSYKWLCPSRPEVYEYVERIVLELAARDGIRGIHLDYIRYPDVILPEALQPKYGLVQDKEYPQFDFCYCEVCRKKFKDAEGVDPLEIPDPPAHEAWRKYREATITVLVNRLAAAVHKKDKPLSAAVFATPTLSRRYVRQDWPRWNLDTVHPMIYHQYYKKPLDWLEPATREGVSELPAKVPLYSGLFIPEIKPDEMARAVQWSLDGGAKGITLFPLNSMKDDHWTALERILKDY
jgi:uncharacterized lipoprotein YddW (UPF0748 family)